MYTRIYIFTTHDLVEIVAETMKLTQCLKYQITKDLKAFLNICVMLHVPIYYDSYSITSVFFLTFK